MGVPVAIADRQQTSARENGLPPLEQGDRLTRAEFHRRYAAMPRLKKAELIEGVVHMPSPVRHTTHGRPHALILTWLGAYYAATPGADFGDNATVILDAENEVQPDALLRLRSGQSVLNADGYIEGAPELIVEVAASSVSYDLHDKLPVYRRNQVREAVIWQVHDRRIDWFHLEEGVYAPLQADADGVIRSRVFPGLWLAVPAMLAEDLATVLTVLQQGVARDEHARFIAQIRATLA